MGKTRACSRKGVDAYGYRPEAVGSDPMLGFGVGLPLIAGRFRLSRQLGRADWCGRHLCHFARPSQSKPVTPRKGTQKDSLTAMGIQTNQLSKLPIWQPTDIGAGRHGSMAKQNSLGRFFRFVNAQHRYYFVSSRPTLQCSWPSVSLLDRPTRPWRK